MAKISILIVLLSHLLCAMVQSQPSSCSEYFTYITKPGITDILGQIEVRPPSANDTFILKVALNTITESPSQVARLELARSIQESLENVHQGRPLLYHVYYDLTYESIASLSAIWFNNQQYCPSPEMSGNITATIELGHILYPPNEEPLLYNNGPWQLNSMPWHRNTSIYRIDNPSYRLNNRLNNESEFDTECGITSYYTDDTNRLISDGEKTLPGQWPWLVAIYIQRTDNESVYDFKCAGSLLTTRHVITEKLCIWTWNENLCEFTLVDPQRVHASFGQFKSREWHGNHTGIINRKIMDYKLSQYTNNSRVFMKYDGLVILILKTAVEYNAFIKPVCLWSGSTDFQDIVNMTGYIVGWGYDVTSTSVNPTYEIYTEEPRTLKVTLTDLIEHIFYEAKLLIVPPDYSEYHSPCDFGGGLVVFNITTNRYQLRGVAIQCAPVSTHYIDVAHHLSWIREQISTLSAD